MEDRREQKKEKIQKQKKNGFVGKKISPSQVKVKGVNVSQSDEGECSTFG